MLWFRMWPCDAGPFCGTGGRGEALSFCFFRVTAFTHPSNCTSYSGTRPTSEYGAWSTSLWVHKTLFWQLSRDRNLQGSGMSHATTASPKPSFRDPRGWATPWSAEEMLDGHHQRVDIPAHARTAHKVLLQKRLEEDLCWIVPHVAPTTQSVKKLNWTEQTAQNPYSTWRSVCEGFFLPPDRSEVHSHSFMYCDI